MTETLTPAARRFQDWQSDQLRRLQAALAGPPADDRGTAAGNRSSGSISAEVRIGGRTIWSAVDLQVQAGEFVAVLGPNGAGKSTLLATLLGLRPLAAGSVQVLGAEPGRHSARIGYLPQRRAFDPATRIRGVDWSGWAGTVTGGGCRCPAGWPATVAGARRGGWPR